MSKLHNSPANPDEVAGKLHDLLVTLWARSRQTIGERLDVLEAAHKALKISPSDPAARRSGADAAHKLAGILGTFGLPHGTEVARRIEVMLEAQAPLRTFEVDTLQQSIAQLQVMIEEKSRDAGKRRT